MIKDNWTSKTKIRMASQCLHVIIYFSHSRVVPLQNSQLNVFKIYKRIFHIPNLVNSQ